MVWFTIVNLVAKIMGKVQNNEKSSQRKDYGFKMIDLCFKKDRVKPNQSK